MRPTVTDSVPKTYNVGRYVIRTFWRGRMLVYDVLQNGVLVRAGFDSSSETEEAALRDIIDRLFGKEQRNAA